MNTDTTYQIILKVLRKRLAQSLSMADAQLPAMSMAEVTNVLFVMHGAWGSIGDYTTTFKGLTALVGEDFWIDPRGVDPRSTLVQ